MQIDTTQITAEVYATNKLNNVLYIKISIPSLRMYINSCTVRPSKYGGLWFQMPWFKIAGNDIHPVEFNGISDFKNLLEDEAMRAAEHYIWDKKLQNLFPGATPVGQDEASDVSF